MARGGIFERSADVPLFDDQGRPTNDRTEISHRLRQRATFSADIRVGPNGRNTISFNLPKDTSVRAVDERKGIYTLVFDTVVVDKSTGKKISLRAGTVITESVNSGNSPERLLLRKRLFKGVLEMLL